MIARAERARLLVVDDDDAACRNARDFGQRLGFEVVAAASGGTAVDHSLHHSGSLRAAVIDFALPDGGGVECLQALREIRPDLPALLAGGCAAAESPDRFGPGGFDGFLQKPFTFERFEAALRHLAPISGPAAERPR